MTENGNNQLHAQAVIPTEEQAAIIALAEGGELPWGVAPSWSYSKWELYFSRLTRSAPAKFYETLGEFGRKNVFKHSQLKFLYLLACLEAPAVSVDDMLEEVTTFLCSHDRPRTFALLYDALCSRGNAEEAAEIYAAAKEGYSDEEREYFSLEHPNW